MSQSNTKRKPDSWIKQELQDARRSLNDAETLHNNKGGSYLGAISSTYYGLFHAAKSSIGMVKNNLSGQHRNQQTELSKFVITSKIPFTHKDLELYKDLRQKRGDSEYQNPKPYIDIEISNMIKRIRSIIERLEEYAHKHIYN